MFGQKGDEGARGFPGPPGPIGLQVRCRHHCLLHDFHLLFSPGFLVDENKASSLFFCVRTWVQFNHNDCFT